MGKKNWLRMQIIYHDLAGITWIAFIFIFLPIEAKVWLKGIRIALQGPRPALEPMLDSWA